MADTPMRIGIAGAKFAGRFHADVWQTIPGVTVAAVAQTSEEARRSFMDRYGVSKGYDGYRELVEDPDVDVIDICVPNFLHAEVAIAAMQAGKDVICEKPLATTLDDAHRVAEVQAKTGRKLFYAEDWIFAPALVRAQQIVAEGGVGKPLYYKGKETHNGSHSKYARTIEYCGGGAVIHVGIHPIGYFYHLLGMPEKVIGDCTPGLGGNFVHQDFEGEDWGVGILLYSGGTRAFVEGNYITTGGMDDRVEIYGTEGVIRADLTMGSPLSVFSKPGYEYAVEKAEFTHGWTRPAVDEMQSLGYRDELTHFVRCLRGEEPQARGTTAQAGLDVYRIVDALYRSNREERTIRMVRE